MVTFTIKNSLIEIIIDGEEGKKVESEEEWMGIGGEGGFDPRPPYSFLQPTSVVMNNDRHPKPVIHSPYKTSKGHVSWCNTPKLYFATRWGVNKDTVTEE